MVVCTTHLLGRGPASVHTRAAGVAGSLAVPALAVGPLDQGRAWSLVLVAMMDEGTSEDGLHCVKKVAPGAPPSGPRPGTKSCARHHNAL